MREPAIGDAGRQLWLVREGSMHRASFSAMASPCEILLDGATDAQAREMARVAAAEAWRVEAAFSRYRDDNLVHRINTANGAPIEVDEELARMIDFAQRCHALSDGSFDITAGVLRRVWRFEPGARPPTRAAVAEVLTRVGWDKVDWSGRVLRMPAGMEIDLGGIGKEYAVDRALVLALAAGRTGESSPGCLVNFGGDLRADRPPEGRAGWRIGVELADPGQGANQGANQGARHEVQPLLELARGACTTSGDTWRCIMHRGRRYGHVLDPRTGFPAPDAPRSVTVRGDTCVETGVLSTLAMLEGREAEAFLDAQGVVWQVQR